MKKWASISLILISLIGLASCQAHTSYENEEKQPLTYLNNTYYRLTHEKSLNIVFTGGSVTDGYGSSEPNTKSWPYLTTEWFKKNFPEANIKGIKKSIGGTGTYLADFRYDSEMAVLKPDLLFIEHTINDKYNGETYESVVRSSETLVRKAYDINPNIDIIYVFSFDKETGGSDYEQLRAHRDVADKYGLLSVKVSDSFYSMPGKTKEKFSKYFSDSVHPNDAGYSFYADVITKAIGEDIIFETPLETELIEKALPKDTLSKLPLMLDAYLLKAHRINLENATGWEHQQIGFSWMEMRYNGRVFADTPGSKLSLTFEGTDFGLLYGTGPKMGKISCTVDNEKPVIIDAYRSHSNPAEARIACNLEKGTHTVVIELLSETNKESMGTNFEIGALLIG